MGHASKSLERVTSGTGVDRFAGDGDAIDERRDMVGREEDGGRIEQHDVAARAALAVEHGADDCGVGRGKCWE